MLQLFTVSFFRSPISPLHTTRMGRAYSCADEELNGADSRNVQPHKVPGGRNDAGDRRNYEDNLDRHSYKLLCGGRARREIHASRKIQRLEELVSSS